MTFLPWFARVFMKLWFPLDTLWGCGCCFVRAWPDGASMRLRLSIDQQAATAPPTPTDRHGACRCCPRGQEDMRRPSAEFRRHWRHPSMFLCPHAAAWKPPVGWGWESCPVGRWCLRPQAPTTLCAARPPPATGGAVVGVEGEPAVEHSSRRGRKEGSRPGPVAPEPMFFFNQTNQR